MYSRVVLIYSVILILYNTFASTGGICSYAQKKKVRQILAKSVNIYPPSSHYISVDKNLHAVCLKYLHSQILKILKNHKMAVI